jgi:outer membrane receptor protein involved in Fe transport
MTYRPSMVSQADELYFGVTNLFNKNPPVDVNNPTSFSSPTSGVYDRIGRYFNAGIRMKF